MDETKVVKADEQARASEKVAKIICDLIDNEQGMTIAEIQNSDVVAKEETKQALIASKVIGRQQVILVVIALESVAGGDENYQVLVRCCDIALKNVTMASMYNLKKTIEARGAQRN